MNERLVAQAKDYARGARWRIVRHRYGVKGKSLVRVASNPPMESMEALLAFLSSEEGCLNLYVDGKPLGNRWRPFNAWYEEARAEDGTNAMTVRVYQALRDKDSSGADGPYLIEDGCGYKVSHTFYWDVPEVIEAPAGSSGVSYELQGVRRDEETQLYSYVLVKRERVAVEVGPWLSHQDGYEDRKTALLLGLREEEDSSVDDKVAAFSQAKGLATEDGGGKVVDVRKSKNDDCTTDVTLENTEEKPVAEAATTARASALATVTRKTDRNQAAPGAAPAAKQGQVATVTNEKTPGGLHDVTTETVESVPVAAGKADAACAKTIFEHEHRETARNQPNRVEEAEEAGGGKVRRNESRLNEDGTFDNTEAETTELPVAEAAKTMRASALATVTRKTDRNQAAPGAAPAATQGQVATVTNEKTPGGLHDVTTETVESVPVAAGKADAACAKTIFEHEHRETARNQPNRVEEAEEAGGGKVRRNESRLNEDGTFDNTEAVTEELEVKAAQKVEEEERFEKASSTTDANAPQGTALPAFVAGTLVRKEARKNPGGTVTETTTTRTAKEATLQLSFKTDARGRTRHYAWFRNLTLEAFTALRAQYTDGSVVINAFGLYDGTLGRTDAPDGSTGDIPGWKAYEAEYEVQDPQYTYHKGNGTSSDPDGWYVAVTTLTIVEGVLNDNAAAAYAKVSGSVSASKTSVRQLSAPTMQNKGWYAYSYVKKTTIKKKFIPGDSTSLDQHGTIA